MIYLVTGLMASGKSTIAELLAQEFEKSVHLRGDLFRRMIVRGRVDMSASASAMALQQLDLRYRLTAHVAREYDASGFTVIVQDNYYGDKLPYMIGLLKPASVQPIVLCPDAEAIKRREAARGKHGYTNYDIDALYRAFMDTTPRLGMWFDTSEETPEQSAMRILAGLRA